MLGKSLAHARVLWCAGGKFLAAVTGITLANMEAHTGSGALAALLERDDAEFAADLAADVRNLVRDGFLLPAE